MNTYQQQEKLIELLRSHWEGGINTKALYKLEFFRFPERFRELRKMGWVTAKVKDPINGSPFDRIWAAYDPSKRLVNSYVPYRASWWGKKGRLQPWEIRNLKEGNEQSYKKTYTFDPLQQVYIVG